MTTAYEARAVHTDPITSAKSDDAIAILAWCVKGSEIGDFGGGSLAPPRRWPGAQWLGLTLGVPSCPEPPGAP